MDLEGHATLNARNQSRWRKRHAQQWRTYMNEYRKKKRALARADREILKMNGL